LVIFWTERACTVQILGPIQPSHLIIKVLFIYFFYVPTTLQAIELITYKQ